MIDENKKEKLFVEYNFNKKKFEANKTLFYFKYKIDKLEKIMDRSLSTSELKELIMKEISFINVFFDIFFNNGKGDILLRDEFKKLYRYYKYALPIIKGEMGIASKEEVITYLIKKIKNGEV